MAGRRELTTSWEIRDDEDVTEVTEMELKRRASILEPGEPLLLNQSVLSSVARSQQFSRDSGLPEELLLSSPLTAAPIPMYTGSFGVGPTGKPLRRWAGTRPEIMWHPLMWLPPHLSGRFRIENQDGAVVLESDDLYVARVALEVTASGLYDRASGTWLDILATVGVDVTDELDLARIQDWLQGEDDEVLSLIDLSEYMLIEPETWGLESAHGLLPDLLGGSLAFAADELMDLADETVAPDNEIPAEEQRTILVQMAEFAADFFGDVGIVNDIGEPTGADDMPHRDYFLRVAATAQDPATPPVQVKSLFSHATDRLNVLREAHWHHLDRLAAEPAEDEPDPAAPEPVTYAFTG